MTTYKSRPVDYGRGTQYLEVTGGIITDQWLTSNGNHSYTGDGNPELVGQSESAARGFGFSKLSKQAQNDMLESRVYSTGVQTARQTP
jgi:hypothetical protein